MTKLYTHGTSSGCSVVARITIFPALHCRSAVCTTHNAMHLAMMILSRYASDGNMQFDRHTSRAA